MMVRCDMGPCPYRSENGFCRRRVIKIDNGGICQYVIDIQTKGVIEEPLYFDRKIYPNLTKEYDKLEVKKRKITGWRRLVDSYTSVQPVIEVEN